MFMTLKRNLPASWHVSGMACKQQAAIMVIFVTQKGKGTATWNVFSTDCKWQAAKK